VVVRGREPKTANEVMANGEQSLAASLVGAAACVAADDVGKVPVGDLIPLR